ncbi:MAG: HlyD family secretion protein [Nitrospiria bacterium]
MLTGRLFAILFISVGIVFSFAGYPFFKNPVPLDYIERVGVIEATEVHLSSKISERVVALPFDQGALVPLGAAVIRLQVDELAAEITRAEADIQRAEANVLTTKAALEKNIAILKEAVRDDHRVGQLYRDKLASTAKRDAARTKLDLARAEIKVAEALITTAEASLKQRHAHLRLYQVRMKEGVIHAPISGIVTLKAYEVGEMVSPGITIVSLIDPTSIWARIDLEEGEVAKIRLGNRAEVFIDTATGKPFTGKVTEIGTTGGFATQRDTTRGRQDIKTFRIKVGLASPKGHLKPGMTVRVRLFFDLPEYSPESVQKTGEREE